MGGQRRGHPTPLLQCPAVSLSLCLQSIEKVDRCPDRLPARQLRALALQFRAVDGRANTLDVPPASLHQRTPLIVGSREEVELLLEYARTL